MKELSDRGSPSTKKKPEHKEGKENGGWEGDMGVKTEVYKFVHETTDSQTTHTQTFPPVRRHLLNRNERTVWKALMTDVSAPV